MVLSWSSVDNFNTVQFYKKVLHRSILIQALSIDSGPNSEHFMLFLHVCVSFGICLWFWFDPSAFIAKMLFDMKGKRFFLLKSGQNVEISLSIVHIPGERINSSIRMNVPLKWLKGIYMWHLHPNQSDINLQLSIIFEVNEKKSHWNERLKCVPFFGVPFSSRNGVDSFHSFTMSVVTRATYTDVPVKESLQRKSAIPYARLNSTQTGIPKKAKPLA